MPFNEDKTNRERGERARVALDAYLATINGSGEVLTDIADLVCDLAHLADVERAAGAEYNGPEEDTAGRHALEMAEFHYAAEGLED